MVQASLQAAVLPGDPDQPRKESKGRLSKGALLGIIIGSVGGFVLLAIIA